MNHSEIPQSTGLLRDYQQNAKRDILQAWDICNNVMLQMRARSSCGFWVQLKMYLAYYRRNVMMPDDIPPVGILLCSEVGQEMAEYTLPRLDEDVFVFKVQTPHPFEGENDRVST